ncbi:MAG: lipocalin family protein [Pseudonocardiaceae bacterium]
MRTTLKTTLILAALAIAAPACGSDPADDLAGEWIGQCTTTQGQNGSQTTSDVDATLELGSDGKYVQSISEPGGGAADTVEGTFTATDETITVVGTDGESVDANYTLNDDALTITTPDPSAEGAAGNSTCNLSRS